METMNVKNATEKFNEVANVKMANISKSRRPAAKMRKEFATRVLASQSDLESLKGALDECGKFTELAELRPYVEAYIEALKPAKKQTKKAAKKVTTKTGRKSDEKKWKEGDIHPNGKWVMKMTKSGKLEWRVLNPQRKSVEHKVGDIHSNGKWAWVEYKPGKFEYRGLNHPAYIAYLEAQKKAVKKAACKAKKATKKAVPAA